jgi:hypothetical protein
MSQREIANLQMHIPHLQSYAAGNHDVLRVNPTDNLVRAVATLVRIAAKQGLLKGILQRSPGRHQGRVRALLSPSSAIRTKKKAVTSQQGGSFFNELTRGLGNLAPLASLAMAL